MKKILLTFDLEEFDLPLEFGQPISQEQIFEIPKKGLMNLLSLLEEYNIQATFFTTTVFAKKYPALLRQISKNHEIACHGYEHSDSYILNISRIQSAKKEIEKIIKKEIKGFRAPRFEIGNISGLSEFGFEYDSSTHPIYLPGRYFNLNQKRNVHKIGDITEIPMSTMLPNFSIFFLAFKNFPIQYSKIFTTINFLLRNYTMLTFHPWEFANLSLINIPNYIKKKNGKKLLDMLEKYILFCKKKDYYFSRVFEHINRKYK